MASDKLNGTLQENLITLLCHGDERGRFVAELVEPDLFEGEYRVIAERAIDYWRKHKKAPGVHTDDLVSDILDDPKNKRGKTFDRILKAMLSLKDGINTEYVIARVSQFSRLQKMKDAIIKAAETLNEQQEMGLPQVEEMLGDLLRAREHNFEPGLTLLDVNKILDFLDSHYSEFRTGIAELDRRNIVPSRGAVTLILAPPGRGKTWALGHIGKQALLQRRKVVHISLEIAAEEMGQRYYQMLFSIPKRDEPVNVAELELNKKGKLKEILRNVIKPEISFASRGIRKHLQKLVKPRRDVYDKGFGLLLPNLVIKRFPSRSLSANGLRAYLDALESVHGFIPDMIILDYVGIMKTDEKNPRTSLGRMFEEYRAICVERNAAGVTAHQVSKMGADAQLVKATHVAEDWSLIMTADQAITYSQTPEEEKVGLARLFVAKARTEEDKFGVVITQSYKLGQFALSSAPLDKTYEDYLEEVSPKRWNDDDDSDVEGD